MHSASVLHGGIIVSIKRLNLGDWKTFEKRILIEILAAGSINWLKVLISCTNWTNVDEIQYKIHLTGMGLNKKALQPQQPRETRWSFNETFLLGDQFGIPQASAQLWNQAQNATQLLHCDRFIIILLTVVPSLFRSKFKLIIMHHRSVCMVGSQPEHRPTTRYMPRTYRELVSTPNIAGAVECATRSVMVKRLWRCCCCWC